MPDDRVPVSLYERDLDAWALSQAAALRAASQLAASQLAASQLAASQLAAGQLAAGQLAASGDGEAADLLRSLDLDNLAEEIEGLARRDRRELGSRLALIVEHLAKLEFIPSIEPRAGWSETVSRERRKIELILRDSPSLRGLMLDFLTDETDDAVQVAAHSLELHGETAAAGKLRTSRTGRGYQLDEVLGGWLPDAPSS